VVLIALLAGIQFLLIGVLGEYVGRIHVEVKRRPRYIVARRSEGAETGGATEGTKAMERAPLH
jgi:hypothetical protein